MRSIETSIHVPPVPDTLPAEWILHKMDAADAMAPRHAREPRPQPRPRPQGLCSDIVTHAYLNHGRWLVRCPWCNSCQEASRTDRRFFCVDRQCLNFPVGGAAIPVVWPEDAEVEQIEHELRKRRIPAAQNWRAGVKVSDLRAANERKRIR